MEKKHAYMIAVHNNHYCFEHLIQLLDDERNDLFIHVDKKYDDTPFKEISKKVSKSNVIFIQQPCSVLWGDFSQVGCEYLLMKEAYNFANSNNTVYTYYHLLSGSDLPLKSQNYLHDFFQQHRGKEFVQFWNTPDENNKKYLKRYSQYHFIKRYRRNLVSRVIERIGRKACDVIQMTLGVNRLKHCEYNVGIGSNWFSITEDLLKFVIENENRIVDIYKHTLCPDESFLQTLVYNSSFISKCYDPYNHKFRYSGNLRDIDWDRGRPYTWKPCDFKELKESKYLFARKFEDKESKELIDKIYEYIECDLD